MKFTCKLSIIKGVIIYKESERSSTQSGWIYSDENDSIRKVKTLQEKNKPIISIQKDYIK
ncbi:MAG: hypothetical protein IJV31_06670 [Clostridia bacterium]|nr:hypothetical protein [Clostridia bacterium]